MYIENKSNTYNIYLHLLYWCLFKYLSLTYMILMMNWRGSCNSMKCNDAPAIHAMDLTSFFFVFSISELNKAYHNVPSLNTTSNYYRMFHRQCTYMIIINHICIYSILIAFRISKAKEFTVCNFLDVFCSDTLQHLDLAIVARNLLFPFLHFLSSKRVSSPVI